MMATGGAFASTGGGNPVPKCLLANPYSETRVCGQLPDPADVVLVVREHRLFFSHPEAEYRCWEL